MWKEFVLFCRQTWRVFFSRMPKPGERFVFDGLLSPWEEPWTIEVLGVEDGWIRYGSGTGRPSYANRKTFMICYRPIVPERVDKPSP